MSARRARPRVIDSTAIMPGSKVSDWARQHYSLRSRLNQYLNLREVWRIPKGRRVTVREFKRWPKSEQWRVAAGSLQTQVDELLRRVLAGQDPRTVLALERKSMGRSPNFAMQQAAVSELARLMAGGVSRAQAIDDIVKHFAAKGAELRSVERWCKRWDERSVDVPEYERILKAAGLM